MKKYWLVIVAIIVCSVSLNGCSDRDVYFGSLGALEEGDPFAYYHGGENGHHGHWPHLCGNEHYHHY